MSLDSLIQEAKKLYAAGHRGRYAPSPTGPLHLGNLRTALLAWLQTRLNNGQFLLRIEDLDEPRTRPGSAEQIIDDLQWLGLDWDEGPGINTELGPYFQSQRNRFYKMAFELLRSEDKIFPCYCSRKDILSAASAPHNESVNMNVANVYPGTCRSKTATSNRYTGQNRLPAWRYLVPETTISFTDQIMGPVSQKIHLEVGDFVIRRSDNLFAYQLAVVVDDALMAITDVVRGVDLLDSTARQIELYKAMGFNIPRFWHVPLMHDDKGKRLSKRDGSDSLKSLRDQGFRPDKIVGQLAASVGLVSSGARLSAQELVEELTIDTFREKIRNRLQSDL